MNFDRHTSSTTSSRDARTMSNPRVTSRPVRGRGTRGFYPVSLAMAGLYNACRHGASPHAGECAKEAPGVVSHLYGCGLSDAVVSSRMLSAAGSGRRHLRMSASMSVGRATLEPVRGPAASLELARAAIQPAVCIHLQGTTMSNSGGPRVCGRDRGRKDHGLGGEVGSRQRRQRPLYGGDVLAVRPVRLHPSWFHVPYLIAGDSETLQAKRGSLLFNNREPERAAPVTGDAVSILLSPERQSTVTTFDRT